MRPRRILTAIAFAWVMVAVSNAAHAQEGLEDLTAQDLVGHDLSGLVFSSGPGGVRLPIADAIVWTFVQKQKRKVGFAFGPFVTDANGHYHIPNMPAGYIILNVSKRDYEQPCAVIFKFRHDRRRDIELMTLTDLADGKLPATIRSPMLSGVVRQNGVPVAGAHVSAEVFLDLLVAHTRTDSVGNYLLCNLPRGTLEVFASTSAGRLADVIVRVHKKEDIVLDLGN